MKKAVLQLVLMVFYSKLLFEKYHILCTSVYCTLYFYVLCVGAILSCCYLYIICFSAL